MFSLQKFSLAMVVGTILFASQQAHSQEHKGGSGMDKNTIVVTGSADVKVKPDIANINVGVVTSAATAAQALADNSASMNALFAVIKAQGVEEKDLRTSNLSVQPQYSQPQPGARGEFVPRVVGYQVTNTVHVKVRQIDRLGAMLDILIQNGANQVYGISFDVDKSEYLLDNVRGAAVSNARRRASLYCSGDRVKPGAVMHIEEQGVEGNFPQPMFDRGMRAMAAASPAPVAGGESTLTVRVRVVFQLEPNE
jgi:uncharacterized protein YggE